MIYIYVLFCFFNFQNILLQQLGIAPFSEGPWPLYIHPQSLSVLSRLLLIWQHKASVQGEPDVPECMKVWERYGIFVSFTFTLNSLPHDSASVSVLDRKLR